MYAPRLVISASWCPPSADYIHSDVSVKSPEFFFILIRFILKDNGVQKTNFEIVFTDV